MDKQTIYQSLLDEYHKPRMDLETGEVHTKQLDIYGREIGDPTPVAPPVGYKKQPTMVEHIRNMIRSERLAMETAAAGAETFEESEDFDIGDDFDPRTPYENDFDPSYQEIVSSVEESRQQVTPPAPQMVPASQEPVASTPAAPAENSAST